MQHHRRAFHPVLLLTKPLGTGVIATALKKNRASSASLEASIASMTRLNRDAAEALLELDRRADGAPGPIHAVTDVTGFGLLGHAREMAIAGGRNGTPPVSFEVDHTRVEYLPGAVEAAREGHLAGGLKNNREFVGDCAAFADSVPQEYRDLLFDPQTSGGLLVAIAVEFADAALAALQRRNVTARAIGRVLAKRDPLLYVR